MSPEHTTRPDVAQPLTLRAFVTFIVVFWVYVSCSRIIQWELFRQGTRTSRELSLEIFVVQDLLLLPILILFCLASRRVGYELHNWQWRAAGHFGLAVLFGMCARPVLVVARSWMQELTVLESIARMDGANSINALKLYASSTLDGGLQYVILQGLITGFTYFARFRQEQWLRSRLETAYERARLHALRMQINPHFLYNTLSAIAGLVRTNPGAAEKMVTQLGELFRRALSERNSEFVPLKQEIEHGEQYLEIQRARFEDRLAYRMQVEPHLESVAIPPLLLQPLLENAVEHGLGTTQGELSIDVTCVAQGNEIALTVRNTGAQPLPATPRSKPTRGFGLRSVAERLDAAFGSAASVALANTAPGQFEARLRFPRLKLSQQPG